LGHYLVLVGGGFSGPGNFPCPLVEMKRFLRQ